MRSGPGGIANPVDVIEQITYLLFLKRLDEIQVLEEKKANRLGKPMERRIFPEGNDPKDMPYEEFRWTRLKNASPHEMYVRLADHIFPFLRTLGAESTYAQYMTDARFTIPESLIARAVDLIDSVPMDDRDTKGDVYEYMLGKLATSGTNGQFRTPRHIIRLMVEMTAPTPEDVMVDPAAGTCGFLVVTGEYLREHHAGLFANEKQSKHFHNGLFHGFENDAAMLRIGSMNMLLHGVENPDVQRRDSLAEDHSGEDEKYSLVSGQSAVRGVARYRERGEGSAARREDEEDGAAVPSALSAAAEAGRPRGGHRARRRAVRLQQGAQGAAADAGRRAEAGRRGVAAQRCRSARTPVCRPPSCCLPRRTPAARTACGSTTWRRMAGRWMTSVSRCCRSRSSASRPRRR